MAGIKDVAKHAGVSIATVSRVLAGTAHVAPVSRKKVEKSIETLGYRPNKVAQSLRRRQTNIIGLIIPDIENSYFTRLSRIIEDTAYLHKKAIFLCNTDQRPEREEHYINVMKDENVAGVIIAPTKSSEEMLQRYAKTELPLVFMDKHIEGFACDSVVLENVVAGETLTSHLLEEGNKHIAAIFNNDSSTGKERHRGYCNALANAHIEENSALVRFTDAHEEHGYSATKEIFESGAKFDALITSNGLLAAGAIRYMQEKKIAIPQQVAFASIDETHWSRIISPQLTVMAQPVQEMATKAVELIMKKIAKPSNENKQYLFTPTLIIRNSSKSRAFR